MNEKQQGAVGKSCFRQHILFSHIVFFERPIKPYYADQLEAIVGINEERAVSSASVVDMGENSEDKIGGVVTTEPWVRFGGKF